MKKTSETLEALFAALADRTRLRLLNLMQDAEVCVCFFVEVLGEPQPKISRHLAYLRKAGLVSARREAKWIHYSVRPPQQPAAAAIFAEVLRTLKADAEMNGDLTALEVACCSTRVPDLLRRAPRPELNRGA